MISKKTGRYYHYDGVLKTLSPEDEHNVWYYRFIENGQEHDLDVDSNQAATNSLTIFINHRLEDYEGNLVGVTGAGLNVNHINQLIQTFQKKYTRNIYFVCTDGTIQPHTTQIPPGSKGTIFVTAPSWRRWPRFCWIAGMKTPPTR